MKVNSVLLSEISNFINGYAFKSKEFINKGIPIIRIGNLIDDDISLKSSVCYEKSINLEAYKILKNDILIAMSGATTGKLAFNKLSQELYLNQRIGIIRATDKTIPLYIFYFLKYIKEYLFILATGSAQPNLSSKLIQNLSIPLPPLKKQKAIAKTLDKAKELIELRKTSIEKLDELSKSIFIDMFGDPVENSMGWKIEKLENLTTKITDGTHKTPNYKDKGIVFVSAKNIKKETLNFKDCKYISIEEHNQLIKRCNPEYQDILLTKSGSTGMSALIPKTDFEFSLFESLCLIKFDKNILNPFFLKSLLNSEATKHQYSKFIKGVAIKHLHLKDIRMLKIIYPKIEEQNKFAKTIQKIETQKALYEKELVKLEENFEALLAKSFG